MPAPELINREASVYVLAAGRQTRFGGRPHKMMTTIADRPAIDYVLDTILSRFSAHRVSFILSRAYPDLANHLRCIRPELNHIIDQQPGRGTAAALASSLPWTSELNLIVEADVYFDPPLIDILMGRARLNPDAMATVTFSSELDVFPSHRRARLSPRLSILPANSPERHDCTYVNVGVCLISKRAQDALSAAGGDVIDFLRGCCGQDMVVPVRYPGRLLHLASPADVPGWRRQLAGPTAGPPAPVHKAPGEGTCTAGPHGAWPAGRG